MDLEDKLSVALEFHVCEYFDLYMDAVMATVGDDEEFLRIVSCMRPEFGHAPPLDFVIGQLALERDERRDTDWISDSDGGNAALACLVEQKAASLVLEDIEAMLATPAASDTDMIILVRPRPLHSPLEVAHIPCYVHVRAEHARDRQIDILTDATRMQLATLCYIDHQVESRGLAEVVETVIVPLVEKFVESFKASSILLTACSSNVGLHHMPTATLGRLIQAASPVVPRDPECTLHARFAAPSESDLAYVLAHANIDISAKMTMVKIVLSRDEHREDAQEELHRWVRLERALAPYAMVIKFHACERLDMPGVGARFVREHGPFMQRLRQSL